MSPVKPQSVLLLVVLFFFILTTSIGLPIYLRPFYYAHIDAMDLAESSGFTELEIREAYDQVMDYLTLPGREFGTGVMAHSESGADHFADCKVLFDLNAGVLLISAALLVLLFLLRRRWGPYRLGKRPAAFWSGILAVVVPLVLGAIAAADFDRFFVLFHSVFFPGKDNWIFDGRTDEIIRVLPQDFFMHCAILIGAGLLIWAVGILIWTRVAAKKH